MRTSFLRADRSANVSFMGLMAPNIHPPPVNVGLTIISLHAGKVETRAGSIFLLEQKNGAKSATATAGRFGFRPPPGNEALALRLLAGKFPCPADGLAGLARPLFRRLFVSAAALHFAKKAFTLQFFLQDPKGLIDIVVSDENFQGTSPSGKNIRHRGPKRARPGAMVAPGRRSDCAGSRAF